jgi:tetratricopeptide (TPR) repeat protein
MAVADPGSPGAATQLLIDTGNGDDTARERMLPLVYEELRRITGSYMSGERRDHTRQPTALVHEALESYRRNLAMAEQLSREDPNNEQYRGDVAYALIRVGDMLAVLGHDDEALAQYRRSQTLRARDVKTDPGNLWKRSSLIEAYAKSRRCWPEPASTVRRWRQPRRHRRSWEHAAVAPTNANFRSFFADSYADLGEAHATMARDTSAGPDERRERSHAARQLYQRSLEIWQDLRTGDSFSAIRADAGMPLQNLVGCRAAA